MSLPQQVKNSVQEYVRLDDGLKNARHEMKEVRTTMENHRNEIIEYMKDMKIPRFELKKGTQYLDLVEKTLKIRPSAECVKQKLTELLAKNITDPETIYSEINKCGGTRHEWKLARRTKRSASTGDKPKKPKIKKQEIDETPM